MKEKKLEEIIEALKKILGNFGSIEDLKGMADSLCEILPEAIDGIGNQKDKDYLNAMVSSNGHSIDVITSMTEKMASSHRYEQRIGDGLDAISSLKTGIDRRKEMNAKLEESDNQTAKESLAFSIRELEKEEAQLERLERDLEKFKLTYGYIRVKEMEKEEKLNAKKKFVILTEDENTAMMDVILSSNDFNEKNSKVFSLRGVNNKSYMNSLELIRFLSPSSVIIVHRDRDLLSEEEIDSWRKDSETFKFNLLMTEGYDIESYFINDEHILALYPEMERSIINKLIQLAREDRREASIGKMVKSNKFGDKKECEKHYNSAPTKYSFTKLVLGALVKRLSEQYDLKVDIIKPSKYLQLNELIRLAKM